MSRSHPNGQNNGPEHALVERLFRNHSRLVYQYAARRLPPSDVDDLVAETFSAAWRRLGDCPHDESQPLWLLGIARGLVSNAQRANARRFALHRHLLRQPEPHVASMATTTTPGNDADAVVAAMNRLRPAQQEVLRLALWDDLSHDDIAQMLGCTTNAVAIRLHRARARLRQVLLSPEGLSLRASAPTPPSRLLPARSDLS